MTFDNDVDNGNNDDDDDNDNNVNDDDTDDVNDDVRHKINVEKDNELETEALPNILIKKLKQKHDLEKKIKNGHKIIY